MPAAVVEPVRFEYEAHEGCPDTGRFFDEVAGRTEHVRRATSAEPARVFVVAVSQEGSQSRARLQITALDGSVTRRDVAADNCADAVSAIALIAALAIDPEASTDVKPELIEKSGGAAKPIEAPPPTGTPQPSPAPPAIAIPRPPSQADQSVTPPDRTSDGAGSYGWSVGATGVGTAGLVPSLALGGGLYVELAPSRSAPFAPSFRASPLVMQTDTVFASPVGANITWFLLRLEACPVRPALSADVIFELCATFDAGGMRVAGTGLMAPETTVNPWFSLGAGGRFVWRSSENVELGFGPGLIVPLRQYPFQYQDEAVSGTPLEAYEIRPFAFALAVSGGYRFP